MRCPSFAIVLALLLTCAAGWAGLDLVTEMQYSHQVGAKTTGQLSAQIEGLEMGGGLPVAATGSLEVALTLEVLEVDEQGIAKVRMSFGELRSEFMGEEKVKDDLEPIEFSVDRLGRAIALEETEVGEVDLLATGGIPLPLLGMLVGVVEMPEAPVPFGEEWTVITEVSIPGIGDVSLATGSHLTEVLDETATVSSVVEAALPDMTSANPMGPGNMQIRQGNLAVDDLSRVIDLASGFVTMASGSMTLTCKADLGGMGEMPLKVLGSFELVPSAPAEEEQAALPPPAGPAPQQRAGGYAQWVQVAATHLWALLSLVPWPWAGR